MDATETESDFKSHCSTHFPLVAILRDVLRDTRRFIHKNPNAFWGWKNEFFHLITKSFLEISFYTFSVVVVDKLSWNVPNTPRNVE